MSEIQTPYLNGHMYQFDLCWIVQKILEFETELSQAIDLRTIHYADPIQWDITTQYAPNTVVVDAKTGTAYISKKAVPSGILLTNEDYWSVIFNYQDIYTKIMEGVAFYNGETDYATKALLVNDLVWYGLDLYRVTRAIEEGGKLIPGTNLVKTSIESLLSAYYGRDRTAQVLNDTLTVSGDYTVNAGDIAETSTNRTIKVFADREVDVDGNDSVHVDGLRTETYASDKTEDVTGTYTGKFGSASFETGSPRWKVKFPDITVDLHDIPVGLKFLTPQMYGIVSDDTSDNSTKWDKLVNDAKTNNLPIVVPSGNYFIYKPLVISTDLIGYGNNVNIFCYTIDHTFPVVSTDKSVHGSSLNYTACICVDPSGGRTHTLTIANLNLYGSVSDTVTSVDIGVFLPDTSNVHVYDLTFNRFSLFGIETVYAWLITIERSIFYACKNGISIGGSESTELGAATSTYINGCYINGSLAGKAGYAFYNTNYSTITNCAYDNGITENGYLFVNSSVLCSGCGIENFSNTAFNLYNTYGFTLQNANVVNMDSGTLFNGTLKNDCYIYLPTRINSDVSTVTLENTSSTCLYSSDFTTDQLTVTGGGDIMFYRGANIYRKSGSGGWQTATFA